jgi:membrane protease YdiL (CAAX protease family)
MALRMDEQSRGDESANPVRGHVHLTLALIFLPFASVIAGWVLATLDVLKGYTSKAELKWLRLFVVLVLVDALVLISAFWMLARAKDLPRPPSTEQPPVIGVTFETDDRLVIREVLPTLPGARAGLKPGDEIRKIDDVSVATSQALAAALQTVSAGKPRSLTVKRGEELLPVTVTPEAPPRPGKDGLFKPLPGTEGRDLAGALGAFLPAALGIVALALWTRWKRRAGVPVWRGFILAAVASSGAFLAAVTLGKSLQGGLSLGTLLIGLGLQMGVMVAMTLVARRWLSRDVAPAPAPLSPLRAGLQGLFYLITGFPRVIVLLGMADLFLFEGRGMGDRTLERIAASQLGVLGTALFVVDVVLLGPFAEETLFRGFLLPRLAAQWGETTALVMSSLIFALFHPHYGPYMALVFFYGWIFGWARLRSGGLAAPVGLHMALNGFVTVVMFGSG